MSEMGLDDELTQQVNPEGFPRCPKCEEFVALESDIKSGGSIEYYVCDCGYRFPLEEAL